MTNNRSIISQHTDKLGQRMVIYSEFCRNYWLVEGYGVNGNLLFTNERIEFWEYRAVVERFMGMPLRAVLAAERNIKPEKIAPVKADERTEVKGSQTTLNLEPVKVGRKELSQKELETELRKLRLIVA